LTLTSDDLESHIVVNVSLTLTNTTIWFVAALCLIVDVRTDGHFTGFIRSSLRRWPKNSPKRDWGHLVTLTLTSDDLEKHIVVNVSSTLTNTSIWFVVALCFIVDGTDGHFYRFIRSSLRRWSNNKWYRVGKSRNSKRSQCMLFDKHINDKIVKAYSKLGLIFTNMSRDCFLLLYKSTGWAKKGGHYIWPSISLKRLNQFAWFLVHFNIVLFWAHVLIVYWTNL